MTKAATEKRELSKVICDILQSEMSLDAKHCMLGDQDWQIPPDTKLFCVVFDDTAKTMASAKFIDADTSQETQQRSALHDVRIEIMSMGSGEARARKEEPGMALDSFYAEQQAEANGIQIGRASEAVNASETEVSKRLIKYVTRVKVSVLHQKVKAPPKYDFFTKFNGDITDASQTHEPPPPATNSQP